MKSIFTLLAFLIIALNISRSQDPFITTWQTDPIWGGYSCNSCITIPTYPGETYNYEVDWNNDGIYEQTGITGDVTHDFGTPGIYTIRLRGTFPRIYFNHHSEISDANKIIAIEQWGDIGWTSMESAFAGCYFLTSNATDSPDLTNVSSLAYMFESCAVFNGEIGNWNTSNVTNMAGMFRGETGFNRPIGNWNTSNVTDMSEMFTGTYAFNQAISNWNTSKVTNMSAMFAGAYVFNQDISNWNTSKVNNMPAMFYGAEAFDQNLGNWTLKPNVQMQGFFDYSGMSCINYDSTLIGWNLNPLTPNNIELGALGLNYWLAEPARNNLIYSKNWNITDDSYSECNYIEFQCSFLWQPYNLSQNVPVNTDLEWEPVENATGYKLSIGTQPGNFDILDGFDVGNTTYYDPDFDLPCGSEIYIKITPTNGFYEFFTCSIEYFITENVIANAGADKSICHGASVQIQASGGSNYSWSPVEGLNDPYISNPVASPLMSSSYTVTVSNEGRCPVTDTVIISVFPMPEVLVNATDETGSNLNNGTANAIPSGGTPPYSFLWSNGQTTQSIANLSPGTYYVTVNDSKGCNTIGNTTINEFTCTILNINVVTNNITCNGLCNGVIDITGIVNGIPPYTFIWNNGNNSNLLTGLCPDSYVVTITDITNCLSIFSFNITQPEPLTSDINITHETANNENNGTAICIPSGGTPPYSYNWSNGSQNPSITGLLPGIYTIKVSDSLGCSKIDTFEIFEFICPQIIAESDINNASCFGICDGEILINSTINSVPPVIYYWNTGDTSNSIENLCAGTYIVTITDSLNCQISVNFTVEQPEEIGITIDSIKNYTQTEKAFIEITASNDSNCTYDWYGPDGFNSSDEDIYDLNPGCYQLVITDTLNNCDNDTTICILDVTSIFEESQIGNSLQLFPNPAKDNITLEFVDGGEYILDIYVSDIAGKNLIFISGKKMTNFQTLNIELFPTGLYILHLRTKNEVYHKKFEILK